ncbi:hypothetical protein [Methylobacterium sp. Gmos1]
MTIALIDALAHHVRWQPAALDAASDEDDVVAQADAVTARWIEEGDGLRRQAWRLHERLGPQPDQVASLTGLIDQADAQVDAFARRYRSLEGRLEGMMQRSLTGPAEAQAYAAEIRDGLLRAMARYGLARADFVLFLKALRDANRAPGPLSPTFDDGDDLIAHLRAALA